MSAQPTETEQSHFDSLPLLRREDRVVREPLTLDEMQEQAHELGRKRRQIDDEEIALKEYTKAKRGDIAKLELERDAIIDLVDRGREVWVECEIRIDESAGRKLVIRQDTREVVADEPLSFRDRQPDLFPATLEDDGPAVPGSRRAREPFITTLGGTTGGDAVVKLHADGFLDPAEWELDEAYICVEDPIEAEPAELRAHIADSESDLDQTELELAEYLEGAGLAESEIVAIAINSRIERSDGSLKPALWIKLRDVRRSRATIDAARATLGEIDGQGVETERRTDLLESVVDEVVAKVNAGALDRDGTTVTAEVRRPKSKRSAKGGQS